MSDDLVVYRDVSRQWRWRKVAPNEEIVASSGEAFTSREHAMRAATRANPEFNDARIEE